MTSFAACTCYVKALGHRHRLAQMPHDHAAACPMYAPEPALMALPKVLTMARCPRCGTRGAKGQHPFSTVVAQGSVMVCDDCAA